MYESFYGLTRCPFALTLDPDLLYLTNQHREALAALSYAIATGKGLVVLTGEVGVGKTTMIRATLDRLNAAYRGRLQYALVVNPHVSSDDLLELVMTHIGVCPVPATKGQRLLRLHDFLLSSTRSGKVSAVILDEAHRFTPDLLEEIRLWTNFETSNAKLLQIVLAGQPELAALLDRSDLRQLKQRIALRVSLTPLTPEDVQSYIEHRWHKCGGETQPFTTDAMTTLTRLSKGYPRLLNALCDNALVQGAASNEKIIGMPHVLQAAVDLDVKRDEEILLPVNGASYDGWLRGRS